MVTVHTVKETHDRNHPARRHRCRGVFWFVGVYNSLISLRNQVFNAWKQIDVQLKRRHDLIPNLVETVKGAMNFERERSSR